MIDIMMNEKQYIESVIRFGTISQDYPARDVNMIVKYCFHELGMRRTKIISYVDEYMYKHYPDYNPFEWHPLIEKYVRKAPGGKLIEVQSVPITEKEMEVISRIDELESEKLLFTMLVISKFKWLAYKANGWVSEKRDEIFRTGNCKIPVPDRNATIHLLFLEGVLELSKSNRKENWRVPFIDEESPIAIQVTSTIDCGLQYMMAKGDTRIIKCADCGKLFIKTNGKMTRCRSCQANHYKELWAPKNKKLQKPN